MPETAPIDLSPWSDGGQLPLARAASGGAVNEALRAKAAVSLAGALPVGRRRSWIAILATWPHVLWLVAAIAVALGGALGVFWAPRTITPTDAPLAKQVDAPPVTSTEAPDVDIGSADAPADPSNDEIAEPPPTAPTEPPKPAPLPAPTVEPAPTQLEYDEAHCQAIQALHGVSVPATASIIEVDGRRLPIRNPLVLASARSPYLFLPRGAHAVRFAPDDPLVEFEITGDLAIAYETLQSYFDVAGQIDEQELLTRAAGTLDVFGSPLLLNLMGAAYAGRGQWGAAERKFCRALRVSPAFTPAHLNLAHCLLLRQSQDEAAHEVRLADAFNVGDVFGLNRQIVELKRRLGIPLDDRQAIELDLSKNALEDDPIERAVEELRATLAELMLTTPNRVDTIRHLFAQMAEVCREAGYEEADEYERMADLVR
jgi:hypothetical protein